MGLSFWVQVLAVVLAYKHTAIPPDSFISVTETDTSGTALTLSDWSFLPAGTLPTSNYGLSFWMKRETYTPWSKLFDFRTSTSSSYALWYDGYIEFAFTGLVDDYQVKHLRAWPDNAWIYVSFKAYLDTVTHMDTLVTSRDQSSFFDDYYTEVTLQLSDQTTLVMTGNGTMAVKSM